MKLDIYVLVAERGILASTIILLLKLKFGTIQNGMIICKIINNEVVIIVTENNEANVEVGVKQCALQQRVGVA